MPFARTDVTADAAYQKHFFSLRNNVTATHATMKNVSNSIRDTNVFMKLHVSSKYLQLLANPFVIVLLLRKVSTASG